MGAQLSSPWWLRDPGFLEFMALSALGITSSSPQTVWENIFMGQAYKGYFYSYSQHWKEFNDMAPLSLKEDWEM